MKGEEIVIRYFALHNEWREYQRPMTTFLNNYVSENRFLEEKQLDLLSCNFKENLNKCLELYGIYAFKTFDETRKKLKSNISLFDAQMISMNEMNLSMEDIEKIDKELLIDKLEKLLSKNDFSISISKSTTDRSVLLNRINKYIKFLENTLRN